MTAETERRMWRASLQPAALLSADEVLEAVPHATAQWVRQRVAASGEVEGAPVYLWGDVLVAVGAEVAPRYDLAHDAAAARLGISTKTLRRAMACTPEGEEVWLNKGSERQPRYRWSGARLEDWFRRVEGWRASERGEGPTRSDGRAPRANPGREPLGARRKPARSPGPSRRTQTSTTDPSESLAAWVQQGGGRR